MVRCHGVWGRVRVDMMAQASGGAAGGGPGRREADSAMWCPWHRGPVRAGGESVAFVSVNTKLTEENYKLLNCTTKTLDTKVVHVILLYKTCKGRHMVWSMVRLGTCNEVQDFHGSKHCSNVILQSF
jgi:hypothetical protein